MSEFLQDLRYAVRLLRRAPSFTAVALLTLTLGIGASAAIFSVVNSLLLQPLPYPQPERLVMLWQDFRERGGPVDEWLTPGNYFDWRARAQAFDDIAVYRGGSANLTGEGEPERVAGWSVTSGFFGVLGVAPALGRDFAPDDDVPGAEGVVILSHGFWARRFGSDPGIVGRRLTLSDQPFTVIGVMPRDFRNPFDAPDLWRPAQLNAANPSRGAITLRAFARLKDGVTLDQARAEMGTLGRTLAAEIPEARQTGILLTPLHDRVVGDTRAPLVALFGAVLAVLLIACANIAGLLLARGAAREREVALRKAVGATAGRIVRQLLTESVVLGGLGALGGLLLAGWLLDMLVAAAPPGTPALDRVRIDGAVLAFTAGLGLLAAAAFGLAPAVQSAARQVASVLKEGGRGSSGSRRAITLRHVFLVGEMALALGLLVGAGLFVRSFVNLVNVDLGVSPERVLTAPIALPPGAYGDPDARRAFFEALEERLAALPGVEVAAMASVIPFAQGDSDTSFRIEGRPEPATPADEPGAWYRIVTPDYFRTTGMRLEAGRLLDASDHAQAPRVAVVNRAMANRYWPNVAGSGGTTEGAGAPVGATIRLGPGDPFTIVGIVADVRHSGPAEPAAVQMYLPMAQFPQGAMTAVVKTTGPPEALGASVRAAVAALDPNLPVASIGSLEGLLAARLAIPRLLTWLMFVFAATALLLAAIGVYGLMAYSVSQRTQELGVRVALGAEPGDVARLVLGQAVRLAAAGVVAGTVAAAAMSRFVASLLHGIEPTDAATFAATAALLFAVAIGAAWLPARRATRVSPVEALRSE